jgi:hypothetical protein
MRVAEAFSLAVNEKRYFYAYTLLQKHPHLTKTTAYKKLQKEYKLAFIAAKKLLTLKKYAAAREKLEPFLFIKEKRPYILLLLEHQKEREAFVKSVAEHNYTKAYKLAKKLPLLEYLPVYKQVLHSLQNCFQEAKNALFSMEFELFRHKMQKLEDAQYELPSLKKLQRAFFDAQKLQNFYEKNNFAACYETIDKHPTLTQEFKLVTLLERHWQKQMNELQSRAKELNIAQIQEILGDLWRVETRNSHLREIFCISFYAKIEKFLDQKAFEVAQKLICTYLEVFGYDTTISLLIKKYEQKSGEKLAILYDYKTPAYEAWREANFFQYP